MKNFPSVFDVRYYSIQPGGSQIVITEKKHYAIEGGSHFSQNRGSDILIFSKYRYNLQQNNPK